MSTQFWLCNSGPMLVKVSMSLLTPSQSVSHKPFHQCLNHKKKLGLRHPLPAFGKFSFFQASHPINKVLQKLTKSYQRELRHLFEFCILIPRKWKSHFNTQCPPSPLLPSSSASAIPAVYWPKVSCSSPMDHCRNRSEEQSFLLRCLPLGLSDSLLKFYLSSLVLPLKVNWNQ